MLVVLLSWLVITSVFLTFGSLAKAVWNTIAKREDNISIIGTFFLGMSLVGTVLSIISIFLPLSISVLIGLLCTSLLYWVVNYKQSATILKSIYSTYNSLPLAFKIVTVSILVVILLFSLCTPVLYDEGLYHLQSMMWSEKYKVVPGLGNLHGRLAFNSNFLLLSTAFNYHPAHYATFFSINGLSLFILLSWIITKIHASKDLIKSLALSTIALLLLFGFGATISSTSTDVITGILITYILLSLMLDEMDNDRCLTLAIIAIFTITLKLSAGLICLVPLIALFKLIETKEYKNITILLLISLLIIAPWLYRFVMLSGYLVYPLSSIDLFNVDWKMSAELVNMEKDAAAAWARIPEGDVAATLNMPFYRWMKIWARIQPWFNLSLFILAFASPAMVFIARKITKASNEKINWMPWILAFSGFLFGYYMAPDLRFGFGFIICSILLPFIMFPIGNKLKAVLNERNTLLLNKVVPMIFFIGLVWLTFIAGKQINEYKEYQSVSSLLLRPQAIDNEMKNKDITFTKLRTNNNIDLFYPNNDNRCFDECIPCMPFWDDRIEMRGTSIEEGFRRK